MTPSIVSPARSSFVPFEQADIEQTIYERFAQQVIREPLRAAVVQRARTTTYEDLDAKARALAARIADRVEAGVPVALLLEQGADFIAGMLGCLLAGTPYVPLDASYPEARLDRMLAVAQPRLVVASHATLELAQRLAGDRCGVLLLDAVEVAARARHIQRATPESPAYILFTSGSTGAPKGVVDCHRNILHNVLRQTNSFEISCDDRQTLLYTCGVYGGARDIFTTLLNGATLFHYDLLTEGYTAFGDWVSRNQITLYCSVTSVFRQLMRHARRRDDFASVRIAKLGGEATRHTDVETFGRWFPARSVLYTGLAATETGTVCQNPISASHVPSAAILPLGFSVTGMSVRLVSPTGEIVRTGTGEIVVESRYLALGYYGDPESTAKKFVVLPDGRRAYRTGDLGRYASDGSLVHCGRGDRQIKIRGNRIEIPEVEAHVLAHARVDDAIVVVRADARGDNALVAYVTGSGGDALAREVRDALARQLPAFMVPAAIVVLDALPRTVNGKVALDRLPDPQLDVELDADDEATPQPDELWKRAVRVRDANPGDNFFAAGGDSLEAINLVERANRVYGVSIPLSEFFRDSTLEHFVALVREQQQAAGNTPVTPVPYVAELERNVSFAELAFLPQHAEDVGKNPLQGRIVRALRLRGALDVGIVAQALTEVVRRHPLLRTTYELRDGDWRATVRDSAAVVCPLVDLSDLQRPAAERIVQDVAAVARERAFDLRTVPQLHAQLVAFDDAEHVLVLDVPHVVADGQSLGIIERDFAAMYDALSMQRPLPVARSADYGQFAALERARFANGLPAEERELLLWNSTAPAPCLPFRADANLAAPARMQAKVDVAIPQLLATLDELARAQHVPSYIASIAALVALVRLHSSVEDVQIVMPWANRPDAFEEVVGCFMSLLSIRVDTSGRPSFTELLRRTRDAARASYSIAATPLVHRFEVLGRVAAGPDLSVNVNFMKPAALPSTVQLAIERVPLEAGSISPAPLTLMRSETQCQLKFRPDLIARSTVEEMSNQLRALIARFIADPDRPFLPEEHK